MEEYALLKIREWIDKHHLGDRIKNADLLAQILSEEKNIYSDETHELLYPFVKDSLVESGKASIVGESSISNRNVSAGGSSFSGSSSSINNNHANDSTTNLNNAMNIDSEAYDDGQFDPDGKADGLEQQARFLTGELLGSLRVPWRFNISKSEKQQRLRYYETELLYRNRRSSSCSSSKTNQSLTTNLQNMTIENKNNIDIMMCNATENNNNNACPEEGEEEDEEGGAGLDLDVLENYGYRVTENSGNTQIKVRDIIIGVGEDVVFTHLSDEAIGEIELNLYHGVKLCVLQADLIDVGGMRVESKAQRGRRVPKKKDNEELERAPVSQLIPFEGDLEKLEKRLGSEHKYEYQSHTADIIFHSWGFTLAECFQQVAVCMFSYMVENLHTEVEVAQYIDVETAGHDLLDLLYHFLDEILFLFLTEFHIGRYVEVLELEYPEKAQFDQASFVDQATSNHGGSSSTSSSSSTIGGGASSSIGGNVNGKTGGNGKISCADYSNNLEKMEDNTNMAVLHEGVPVLANNSNANDATKQNTTTSPAPKRQKSLIEGDEDHGNNNMDVDDSCGSSNNINYSNSSGAGVFVSDTNPDELLYASGCCGAGYIPKPGTNINIADKTAISNVFHNSKTDKSVLLTTGNNTSYSSSTIAGQQSGSNNDNKNKDTQATSRPKYYCRFRLYGERFRPREKHRQGTEIKAITMHEMRINLQNTPKDLYVLVDI